jgi:pimeloyl-ACP methyl ester carboxylesterase
MTKKQLLYYTVFSNIWKSRDKDTSPMPLATTSSGPITYTRSGSGAPLVLCLPQSSGPVGVGPFVEALAAGFSVIRYDQRGTGGSAPPSNPAAVTMADRAGEVAELLEALEIPRAHLFCHSTGCGIGLAFAHAYPEKVERLVLATPWEYGDPFITMMQNLRIAAARALSPRDYAIYNASLLFPPGYRRLHAEGFAAQAASAPAQDADQIASRLHAILAFDTRPLTPEIRTPTLVVSSDDDQLMPYWFGRDIAARMPNARYEEIHGGGHMLPETKTEVMAGLVKSFLDNAG